MRNACRVSAVAFPLSARRIEQQALRWYREEGLLMAYQADMAIEIMSSTHIFHK